jgi:hypothetical protein
MHAAWSLVVAVLPLCFASLAFAAEPTIEVAELPLKNVLALDMPGTQDLRAIDSSQEPILDRVLKQIGETRKYDHCFVVKGEGADALREFLRVREDHEHWNRLPVGEPVSLIFYTKPIPDDVVLHRIERRKGLFTLHFRFAPREGGEPSPRLAVIPVGKLAVGRYTVRIERSSAEQRHLDAGYRDPPPTRFSDVCMGAGFEVVDGPGDAPPPPETVEIPLKDIWAYNMPGTRDINEFGSPKAADSLVEKVIQAINETWHDHEGVVVEGVGRAALERLYESRNTPKGLNSVSVKVPLTIAFYAKSMGWRIRLDSVSKRGNIITVRYRPVPTQTRMSRATLALIPIGELPPGKYRVIVDPLPMEEKYVGAGASPPPSSIKNNVSGSFGFAVFGKDVK